MFWGGENKIDKPKKTHVDMVRTCKTGPNQGHRSYEAAMLLPVLSCNLCLKKVFVIDNPWLTQNTFNNRV